MKINKGNKKEIDPFGVWFAIMLVLLLLYYKVPDTSMQIFLGILIYAVIAISFFVFILKLGKNKSSEVSSSRPAAGTGSSVRSHDTPADNIDNSVDRLNRKQQLDGFLKAGIIDKNEYKALLNKNKQSFRSGKNR